MEKIVTAGLVHRDLEPALLDRVEKARRTDRARPISIIVGSNLLASHLGRALAIRLGGLFNVRFATFADLARALAGSSAGEPRSGLPQRAGRLIVDELLSDAGVPEVFAETAGTRGFGEAIRATFSDLSEGGCTAALARAMLGTRGAARRLGEKARGALDLFARYRELVDGLGGDIHSTFEEALRGNVSEELGSTVIAYGFYDLNEMQSRLLDRVASRAELEVFLPWDGAEAYGFADRLRERLARDGFDIRAAGAGRAPSAGRDARPAPVLLSLPGEEEEIREIARRILTLARDEGARFDETAVLLASPETYADLVRGVFDEAGIPCSLGFSPLLSSSAAARSVRSLIALIERGFERRELVEFLVSAPLRPIEARDATVDHAALWARLSAEAGIAGEGGWIEENEALAARVAASVERGEAAARSLDAVRHAIRSIRAIREARESMQPSVSWTGLADLLAGLSRALFLPSEDVERACGILESLGELDAVGIAPTPQRFLRMAAEALEEEGVSSASPGGGVRVLTLNEARGLSFRALFLPGLAEGAFPAPRRQDPFLDDADRAAIEGASTGAVALSRKGERIAEEALLFAMALESGRDASVLSVPRFEQETGKERIPSFFLRYAGFSAPGFAEAPVPGAIRLGRGAPERRGVELLSLGEFDFESARESRAGGGAPPSNELFLRGARLVRERWGSKAFTPYDGVFSSERSRAALRSGLEKRGYRFSPTSLERWASCPFAYFLHDLLGVEALEEPERNVSPTPAQRGTLVHRILAGVYGSLASAGLLPARIAPPERLRAAAEEIAERLLEEFPLEEPVGIPLFWEMEKEIVRRSVRSFLDEERLQESDFVPAHFERAFGRGDEREAVGHDRGDRLVYFRGRIDRIDEAPDGRFRVIDYKTGRLLGRDQDLAGGTALQLPIYLLAAARLLDRPVESGEAFYLRVGAGGKRSIRFAGDRWEEIGDAFSRAVETATRGIEEGIFFAPATDDACRRCGFKIACVAGAGRLFERKARSDPRARAYLYMRGCAEENEI